MEGDEWDPITHEPLPTILEPTHPQPRNNMMVRNHRKSKTLKQRIHYRDLTLGILCQPQNPKPKHLRHPKHPGHTRQPVTDDGISENKNQNKEALGCLPGALAL